MYINAINYFLIGAINEGTVARQKRNTSSFNKC